MAPPTREMASATTEASSHGAATTRNDKSLQVLQHNLIALVYISGPEEILVRCLQRWGGGPWTTRGGDSLLRLLRAYDG